MPAFKSPPPMTVCRVPGQFDVMIGSETFGPNGGRLGLLGPVARPGACSRQVATTAQWSGRLSLLQAVLASRVGLIPIEETPLVEGHIGLQGFKYLIKALENTAEAGILETPKEPSGSDEKNLKIIFE